MPLGIEQNSIAPQLVQNSGAALVQGIRQIGQQISNHLTEIQTRRDLGAMAQEMQSLNVQSNDFPVQLTQMLSRHPLAARDERGQMALSILGKAHGQWQAGEAEARAFNRAMAMQTRRRLDARDQFDYEEKVRRDRPVSVAGVGLVNPSEIDPITGQAKVLAAAPPKGSSVLPFASSPSGIFDRRTGEVTSPAPAKTMTEYQKAQMRRAERKDKISAINQEINQLDSDISSAVKQYESSFNREEKATDATEKARHQGDKTEIGKIADTLKAKKAERLEMLRKLREEDNADASIKEDAPDNLGLPPVSADAAAPAPQIEMIAVIDPNGRPGRIKASQLEAALANGYKRR